jgi:hypothetical protein
MAEDEDAMNRSRTLIGGQFIFARLLLCPQEQSEKKE